MKAKTKRKIFIILFLLPTLIAFAIFYLYPIVTVFVTSFCKWDYENLKRPEFFPVKDIFSNYKYIFRTYPYFKVALVNSLKWSACGALIGTPVAVVSALVISWNLPGSKIARNVYILPSIISSAAMGLIFLQLYNPRYGMIAQMIRSFHPGFKDSILLVQPANFWALTFSYIFFQGTTCLMLMGQIASVPGEIYDAAKIDGATGWKREWYITLPSIKDMIKTIVILGASSGFLIYNEIYFLTKGAAGTTSLSYILRELAIVSPRAQYGRANVIGVILILGGLSIIGLINLLFGINLKALSGRRKEK